MQLLVLEGLDGAGKSTQLKLIRELLIRRNKRFKCLHYPRTDTAPWGEIISMFLRGELGKIENVDPYLVALMYAGDRNDSKPVIEKWISEGFTVILDRYVYSNIAYQCAKIDDTGKKRKLKDWILKIEFEHFSLHKPDLCLFLDVPFEFTVKNLKERNMEDSRSYLKGRVDIHEQNLDFQNKVRREYLSLVEEIHDFKLIECFDKQDKILSVEEIFEKIKNLL